jgi:hypothetical protein
MSVEKETKSMSGILFVFMTFMAIGSGIRMAEAYADYSNPPEQRKIQAQANLDRLVRQLDHIDRKKT